MAENKLRFNILDPARLVAALAVLFYHYSIYIPTSNPVLYSLHFGYLGVNFFFVLSGFVIMASAQNRSAIEFAKARALRLYPAFIFCLLITLAVSFFVGGIKYPIRQTLANATILNDYLNIKNIDGVFWTLQAELKFYGCIFLLLITGMFRFWRFWLSIWLALAISHHFTLQPFFMGWLINPSYSFYFIGGVSAYLIYLHPKDKQAPVIFFLSLIFAFVKAKSQAVGFIANADQSQAFIAGLIIIAIFLFFLMLAKGMLNITPKSYWGLIGALSYPLYLIHNHAGKQILLALHPSLGMYASILITTTLALILSYIVVQLEEGFRSSYQKIIAKPKEHPRPSTSSQE